MRVVLVVWWGAVQANIQIKNACSLDFCNFSFNPKLTAFYYQCILFGRPVFWNVYSYVDQPATYKTPSTTFHWYDAVLILSTLLSHLSKSKFEFQILKSWWWLGKTTTKKFSFAFGFILNWCMWWQWLFWCDAHSYVLYN